MKKRRIFCFHVALFFLSTGVLSQDTLFFGPNLKQYYLDSLKADSIREAFILSHRPLTEKKLNLLKFPIRESVYGKAVTSFIAESMHFKISPVLQKRMLTIKYREPSEWLFYSYAILFVFLGSILSISPDYLKVVLGLLLRRGSHQDKSREMKLNTSIPSLMMNILFIISTSFFIYFALSKVYGYNDLNPIGFVISCATLLAILYLLKFFFLQLCGWLFRQKATFDGYFSYFSLVNKGIGLLLLGSSTLMAFGVQEFTTGIYMISLIILSGLLAVRVVNSFFIFSQPFRIGLPEFMIGFVSLEMMPTLLFLKFLHENSAVLLNGFL